MSNLINASKATLESSTTDLIAKGYQPLSSGLQAGTYSGIVDNVDEFISIRTYEKPNGAQKGGIMYAVRANIAINGGQSYKVYGFENTGAKKLLLTKDQIKVLEPNCSFTFEITEKGYSAKVAIAKAETVESNEVTEATISAMSKPKLTALASENGIDVKGLDLAQLRSRLVTELF